MHPASAIFYEKKHNPAHEETKINYKSALITTKLLM